MTMSSAPMLAADLAAGLARVENSADPGDRLAAGYSQQGIRRLRRVFAGR